MEATVQQSQHTGAMLMSKDIYRNAGNAPLLALVPDGKLKILDVGCGAGDNARILQARGCTVYGLTLSDEEARLARPFCKDVFVKNAEFEELDLPDKSLDLIICSHVLEHMIQPAATLTRLCRYLRDGGQVLIAVPNMAHWRLRVRFLRGDWHREPQGMMDRTHLQFFSFTTGITLLNETPLTLEKHVAGDLSIPLWPLRRLFPGLCARLDTLIGRHWPNLYCTQTLLLARKSVP
jgi:2-polyprenyl-3-methyl-5-hydroxy-6-metoxy-1,4-benzoquinol methylase